MSCVFCITSGAVDELLEALVVDVLGRPLGHLITGKIATELHHREKEKWSREKPELSLIVNVRSELLEVPEMQEVCPKDWCSIADGQQTEEFAAIESSSLGCATATLLMHTATVDQAQCAARTKRKDC